MEEKNFSETPSQEEIGAAADADLILLKENLTQVKVESYSRAWDENTRISRAIELVYQYVKDRLEKTDTHGRFEIHNVYVVWFCKTLQNWKAMVSTTLPDGMYYEVTYNGDEGCSYIDAYKKFENVRVFDYPDPSI